MGTRVKIVVYSLDISCEISEEGVFEIVLELRSPGSRSMFFVRVVGDMPGGIRSVGRACFALVHQD